MEDTAEYIAKPILPYSPEWYTARIGKFTSSEIHRLMTDLTGPEIKAGETLCKGGRTYVMECVAEILTGVAEEQGFVSEDMLRGSELEREAMQYYTNKTKREPTMGIFIVFSERLCGTPDGVEHERVNDAKCPKSTTHLQYLQMKTGQDLLAKNPANYWQLVCNGYLAGKTKGTLISYDPRFKNPKLKIKVLDFDIPEEDTGLLITKLNAATAYLTTILEKIQSINEAS